MSDIVNDDALVFSPDGWRLTVHGDDPAREGWAATLLALSNGAIGVRGAIEERAHATTFLAHAFEQSPIHYHERLHGFAASTDTRVPVAEALGLELRANGVPLDLSGGEHDTGGGREQAKDGTAHLELPCETDRLKQEAVTHWLKTR